MADRASVILWFLTGNRKQLKNLLLLKLIGPPGRWASVIRSTTGIFSHSPANDGATTVPCLD